MADYRFYFFSSRSTLSGLKSCHCSDDAMAVAHALIELKAETHIEIWDRERKVAIVPENHPASD